jgi:hypothetical protein
MDPATAITLLAVVLIVLAIVVFLVATIVELRKITIGLDGVIPPVGEIVAKTGPVNDLVGKIVSDLQAGTNLLEGLLIKKAGVDDGGALIESMFPGGGQAFFARQGRRDRPRKMGVVYTRGALQLARLGRGSPLGSPMRGTAIRDKYYAESETRKGTARDTRVLYPDTRGVGPTGNSAGAPNRPKSPVVGGASPFQYLASGAEVPMPSIPVTEQYGGGARPASVRVAPAAQPTQPSAAPAWQNLQGSAATAQPSAPPPEPAAPPRPRSQGAFTPPKGDTGGILRYRR